MSDNLWVNFLGYKVKAMIHPIVSIAAFFVDQLSQAPVQVQCILPPNPDPGLKQWIPTAVSLLSVGIGLWIANRTIRNARELTEWSFRATSERDHERWILDQKKAEWGKLFTEFTEVKKEFLPIYKDEKTAQSFVDQWDEMEQRIDYIAMPFIFIAQKLIDIEFYQLWQGFKEKASKDNARISELIKNRLAKLMYGHTEGDPIQSIYCDLENEYIRIIVNMRLCAEEDLDIKSPAKS
jgi:hypothetical protein